MKLIKAGNRVMKNVQAFAFCGPCSHLGPCRNPSHLG